MFVIILTYKSALSEVDAHLSAHISWLEQQHEKGVFVVSGRRVPRTGGVILARQVTQEELMALLDQDPFKQQGLADYEVVEFCPTKAHADFGAFLNP